MMERVEEGKSREGWIDFVGWWRRTGRECRLKSRDFVEGEGRWGDVHGKGN